MMNFSQLFVLCTIVSAQADTRELHKKRHVASPAYANAVPVYSGKGETYAAYEPVRSYPEVELEKMHAPVPNIALVPSKSSPVKPSKVTLVPQKSAPVKPSKVTLVPQKSVPVKPSKVTLVPQKSVPVKPSKVVPQKPVVHITPQKSYPMAAKVVPKPSGKGERMHGVYRTAQAQVQPTPQKDGWIRTLRKKIRNYSPSKKSAPVSKKAMPVTKKAMPVTKKTIPVTKKVVQPVVTKKVVQPIATKTVVPVKQMHSVQQSHGKGYAGQSQYHTHHHY